MQPSPRTNQDQPDHEAIAYMAYLIWEQEGRPIGRDQEHWLQAESQWRVSARKQPVKALKKAAALSFRPTGK